MTETTDGPPSGQWGVCVGGGTAGRRRKHLASLHAGGGRDREAMALWVAAGAGGLPLETSCGHCLPGEGML